MEDSLQPDRSGQILSELLRDRILPELVKKSGIEPENELYRIDELQKFRFNTSEIISFSELLLVNDFERASKIVDRHIESGCSAPNLVLELLCNAARHLGELWCRDESSFADVTIGMASLHQMLRYLDERLARDLVYSSDEGNSILLVTMPGDTHIFGVSVLEAFFRNSGWVVKTDFEATRKSLIDCVSSDVYDVVGFSVAHTEGIGVCKALTTLVRKHSINTKVKVMAGGSSFLRNEKLKEAVGVDATATGALDALQTASILCAPKDRERLRADHA